MSDAINPKQRMSDLLRLAHEVGREERRMAILGEGNVSCSLGDGTFLVKASGSTLAKLDEAGVTECRSDTLLPLLDEDVADADGLKALEASKVDADARRPSVEASFHAYLLTRPGVNFVAHVHPEATNAILCSPKDHDFAHRRLCPDEIVVCGAVFAEVPYVDPGFALAARIRSVVESFEEQHGRPPRVILLANHGVITTGGTADAALAAMLMCDKAARTYAGAAALGGPRFMSEDDVKRIDGREDEAYRRKALNL
jgi:rhamnose utilization protein RhaD (predicted bifunctional aldolase and dehydrogenase)